MKKLILILLFLIPLACTTHPHSEGRESYIKKIQEHSAGDKQFAGLYHNFEFRSTILTRDISQTIHNRLNQYYDWSDEEAAEKLQTRMDELNKSTKIWLSFYTPNRKDDNLTKKISIWKIYLMADGRRYEGHASKANKNLSEAKALIPYHTRWATAYYITFPVPTDEIENSDLKLVITGPLGRREADFPRSL